MFLGEYVQHEEAVSFQLHSSDKQGHYADEDEDVLQPVASPFRTQDVSHTHGQQENGRRDAQPPCNTSKKLPNNAIVEPFEIPPASQEQGCDQFWKVLLESSQRIYACTQYGPSKTRLRDASSLHSADVVSMNAKAMGVRVAAHCQ